MDNLEEIEIRLWEYIDGLAEGEQRSAIEKLVQENAEWKAKYHELLEIHRSIGLIELEQPSMRFTRNVMEEIAKHQIAPAARNYINNKIVWGIGGFFIFMLVGFLIYGIGQINWSAASDSNSTLGIDLGKVDYSRMFSNSFVNVFMMLNVVLALVLLDRYLANRNKKLKQA